MELAETMEDDKATKANVNKREEMTAFGNSRISSRFDHLLPSDDLSPQQQHDTPLAMDMDIDHNSSVKSTMVVERSPYVKNMMILRRECRGLRLVIEKNSEYGWTCSSTSKKSKRFCNTMDKTIDNKSVYEWLSDPRMDTWLPSDCEVAVDTALQTSRLFFNYHTLTPDRRRRTCMDNPTLNATCKLDHDYEGLCSREFLGIPLMFYRLICRFALLRGVNISHLIGELEFEDELERLIQAYDGGRDSFWDGFDDWLKSDQLISSCLPNEMVQAMVEEFNTTNSKAAEDNPHQGMGTTRQKRKNPTLKSPGESDLKKAKETTKYPELNGLVRLRPEAKQIFEAVYETIANESTASFEERQRRSGNRCVMTQLSTKFDKKSVMRISTRNAAFKLDEPLDTAVGSTDSFRHTIDFPQLTARATDLPCAVSSCPHALQLESIAGEVDAASCRYFQDTVTVHHRVGAELRYNGIVVGFVHSAKHALGGEVPPETSHPFIREFITRWNGKKPAAITADRVPRVLDILTEHIKELNLYDIIMGQIRKIKLSDPTLGGIIERAYDKFYLRMSGYKSTLKKPHATTFWEFLHPELNALLSVINTYASKTSVMNNTIPDAIHTILKYLDIVVFQGEIDFYHVLLRLHHLSKCSNPQGNKRGGGWWDNVLGNTNKKVLGYSFADVGNDLVLKPIYSEEEYKKLKHRQYINILLNIRQQQIENRIKQEQQTILNKQKPMISAIRNSLGFKPLRPVISYPQSHQPDLSKQKTMFSAVGNTIKRINPFKTPINYQTEGGKFTKKIKKTKQTRKYKPLSNKRTSYKLYR